MIDNINGIICANSFSNESLHDAVAAIILKPDIVWKFVVVPHDVTQSYELYVKRFIGVLYDRYIIWLFF